MKHQSNEVIGAEAATAESAINRAPEGIEFTLDRDQIERYIAEGRRMQAEAIATFFKRLFARIASAQPKSDETKGTGQTAGNPALQA
ncbi:RSP_7527 family protein [Pelagibius sp.]|uniref:RSP_7527 family protein n=1 Tax=Pelagibius sp. TaxID=1931238 RepID=UPI003BB02042